MNTLTQNKKATDVQPLFLRLVFVAIQSATRVSHLVKPDDMWVAKHLHNLNFSEYLLQVFFIQLALVYDLDSNLTTEENVCCSMKSSLLRKIKITLKYYIVQNKGGHYFVYRMSMKKMNSLFRKRQEIDFQQVCLRGTDSKANESSAIP